MILDSLHNISRYRGISAAMDAALNYLATLHDAHEPIKDRVEIMGDDAFAMLNHLTCTRRPMRFEFHRKYADIHVPLSGVEQIALCSTSASMPDEAAYDAQKDVGFFDAAPVNIVSVPAGWFCICFPDDAHVPGYAAERELSIDKLIVKVRA